MSFTMTVSRRFLGSKPNRLRTAESAQRAVGDRGESAPIPRGLRKACEVSTTEVQGRPVITLTPRSGRKDADIVYLHGGAFINTLAAPHWSMISALISRTGATVTVPLYGLAPEHTASEALDLTTAVFGDVVERAPSSAVHLAGDSAGGTLAMSLAVALRDAGGPTPAALFLFAPWLDISMRNPAMRALVPHDVMLDIPGLAWCGEQWARSSSVDDPHVNPMADHLGGLPPLHVYQGVHDIFLADAMKFAEKAEAAGAAVDLHVTPSGFHVFMGATFTPEAKEVFDDVARVVAKRGDQSPT